MMKITDFGIDEEKEAQGVWVDVGDGLRLKVARMGNPAYTRALLDAGQNTSLALRYATINDDRVDAVQEAQRRAMSKHVLLGWEGLAGPDGNEVEYDEATAYEFMSKYKGFYEMVLEIALDKNRFRTEERDAAEGN